MMGRSNCGKSSLINRWLGRKGLAKTSSTPGRTRLLNFFSVTWTPSSDPMTVVDLPGYGYAAAPKAMVKSWQNMIGDYLSAARPNRLGFLLLDVRRSAQKEEKDLARWLTDLNIPFQVVATKADKLSLSRVKAALSALAQQLGGFAHPLAFSALNGQGREHLIALVKARQELIQPSDSELAPPSDPTPEPTLDPTPDQAD
jgi:GTP-binding protein